MVGLSLNLNAIITNSVDQLCKEYLELKLGYFTDKGKAGWAPLKPETIARKRKIAPEYATDFNIQTGRLRDSLEIRWVQTDRGVRIIVEVKNQDNLVRYLTQTLKRNFLNIDANEKKFLTDRLLELIKINATS